MSALLFKFTDADGILKIAEPGKYDQIYKRIRIKEAHLLDEDHSVIKLYKCRVQELTTQGAVVLDHCNIGTVKAKGNILCLASTIGTLKTEKEVVIQSNSQVSKVESACKLYIFGNTQIRCPEIETLDDRLYTDCCFGFTLCGPRSLTKIAWTFHLSQPCSL